MKDYTLSEIKAHCNHMTGRNNEGPDCDRCAEENLELHKFCVDNIYPCPCRFEVESRDMIELPCKEHFVHEHDDGHVTENWRVFYRGEFALIETAFFLTEAEADTFLADLKGGKQ